MGQNSCQPEGLQPESAAHRSVEQGSAQRGAGVPFMGMRSWSRSWTHICRSQCASAGSDPRGNPLPPSDAPRLRGCDRAGACKSRRISAPSVALRGRIHAHSAWNLLRPPRDAALLVLAIERLLPSPGALPSPILAATHACFIMLGTLNLQIGQITGGAKLSDPKYGQQGQVHFPAITFFSVSISNRSSQLSWDKLTIFTSRPRNISL